jgi:hypothetical protein
MTDTEQAKGAGFTIEAKPGGESVGAEPFPEGGSR